MAVVLQDNPCIVRGEYTHKEYVLYKTTIRLRDYDEEKQRKCFRYDTIYLFSQPEHIAQLRNADKYKPCAIPEGKLIGENKIGAPILYDKER